ATAVLIVQVAAGSLATYFSTPLVAPVLRAYSAQFLISAFGVVPGALLLAQLRFRELAIIQVLFGIAQAVATILLALSGAGVWSLVGGVLIGNTLRVALLTYSAKPPLRMSLRFSLLRPYWSFSGYLLLQRMLWFWAEQADQFFIARFQGSAPLG